MPLVSQKQWQRAAPGLLAGSAKWIPGLGHTLLLGFSSAQVTFSPESGSPQCINWCWSVLACTEQDHGVDVNRCHQPQAQQMLALPAVVPWGTVPHAGTQDRTRLGQLAGIQCWVPWLLGSL